MGLRQFSTAFAGAVVCLSLTASAAPLTLDEAIRLGLAHNPRIKVSDFSRDIARAKLLAAYGAFDPALIFRRSYSQDNTPISIDPFSRRFTQVDDYRASLAGLTPWGLTYSLDVTAYNQRDPFNNFSDNYETFGGISIVQPLLRGFGLSTNWAPVRVAKAARNISDWQHRQTIIDTITNVVFAYNNLQQARDELRIARGSRDRAAQLLEGNIKRNRIGALSDADVIQARARVANREEAVLFAERSVQDRENQLRALLGETSFSPEADNLNIVPLPPALPLAVDVPTSLKRAFELRPDYQAAKAGITIQRASTASAVNQLLPNLDLVGSYGYAGLDRDFSTSRAQVRARENRAYSVGLVVTIPLTFAEGRGNARAARLTLRQSEADLDRLGQDIALAVATAIGQMTTTQLRVKATASAYELALQALDAEQKRFRAGTSTTFLVLQLQEQLAVAERSYAGAVADERRAIANYERTIGVTLESHRVTTD